MDYSLDTLTKIIDAKLIVDKVLWLEDSTSGSLSEVGIDRSDVQTVSDILSGIISENGISYEHASGIDAEFNVTHWTEIDAALTGVLERLNAIDDAWFWTEQEYPMEDLLFILTEKCGVN